VTALLDEAKRKEVALGIIDTVGEEEKHVDIGRRSEHAV
jgi:hypothetical protein